MRQTHNIRVRGTRRRFELVLLVEEQCCARAPSAGRLVAARITTVFGI